MQPSCKATCNDGRLLLCHQTARELSQSALLCNLNCMELEEQGRAGMSQQQAGHCETLAVFVGRQEALEMLMILMVAQQRTSGCCYPGQMAYQRFPVEWTVGMSYW